MENPEEPNNLNRENEGDNNNNDNYDLLLLSLSPYSERRVRARPSASSSSSAPPLLLGVPLHPAPADEMIISKEEEESNMIVIVPPYPWATDRPAKVHTMKHLIQNKILSITGQVQCGSCHIKYEMSLNLVSKFREVMRFVGRHGKSMHNRAPEEWKHPVLPTCRHCGAENSVKPITGDTKDHSVNWLFLLLAQLLGSCTLEHLRYFCNHNRIHRSGAKDRVLFHTYSYLIKQLLGKV